MNFCLIILAAGNSNRFKSNLPKPYHRIGGKTLLEITIKKATNFKAIKKIIVVYAKKDQKKIKELNLKNISYIVGGSSRQKSTFNALKFLINQKKFQKF